MDRFEQKLDVLLEGQSQQAIAIQSLKDTIGNGLSGDIRRTRESMEDLQEMVIETCKKYDRKFEEHDNLIVELNKFDWFRRMANRFRDHIIGKLLLMAVGGGVIFWLIYVTRMVGK
jgi:hypothetical protein